MTDTATIEALLERLDGYRSYNPNTDRDDHPICDQAASTIRALSAENEQARRQAYEECAAICEAQKQEFLSEQYAVGQPISSIRERFACTQIEEAIRAKLDTTRAIGKES